MEKMDAFIKGIGNILLFGNILVEGFPSPESTIANTTDTVMEAWLSVGKSIQGALDSYGQENSR